MISSDPVAENKIRNHQIQLSDTVQVLVGEYAFQLLSDEVFSSEWDDLYRACAWSTVFQSRKFVTTWYNSYKSDFIPVLVIGKCEGKLSGLLHLAQSKNGMITGAGEELAEYHVWLTDSRDSIFIKEALKEVYKYFNGSRIQLKYLPAETPLECFDTDLFYKKHCSIEPFKQPLLKLELDHLEKELKKKNRKEKINRLKRLGRLDFEHITDYDIFSSIINELITQFEFRKAALYNNFFFRNDHNRKIFLLRSFQKGLLHVSVLKLNGEVIASNVSFFDKHWAHLQGLNTHAPIFAKYSPGIIHFLMLGQHLSKNDFDIFDLTPGDDPYKDILATNYITSYKLVLDKSFNRLVYASRTRIAHYLKKGLLYIGILPKHLKNKYTYLRDKIKHVNRQDIIHIKYTYGSSLRFASAKQLFILHNIPAETLRDIPDINKNNLSDLMMFKSEGFFKTRWKFLKEAMERFENGQNCYTYCENGVLLYCVWLRNQLNKEELEYFKVNEALPSLLILDDVYYDHQAINKLPNFLSAVSAIAIHYTDTKYLYATVRSYDKVVSQAMQSIGYKRYDNV